MVVCNKIPTDDGAAAVDLYGTIVGIDEGKTEISYRLPKENFACFKEHKPPSEPPKPADPKDDQVGQSCA